MKIKFNLIVLFASFSGFLVSYIYFRNDHKGNLDPLSQGVGEVTAGIFHFFGLIGYRFVRLTAPYMFVLGLVEVVMKYFHHNSVFETPTPDHENCPNYWWRNILYINTLFPVEQMVNRRSDRNVFSLVLFMFLIKKCLRNNMRSILRWFWSIEY